jgi:hypothetical protein
MLRANHTNGTGAVGRRRDEAHVERVFDQAADYGVKAIITISEASLMRPLKVTHQRHGTQVCPIVPNIPSYVREASNYGLVGAGIRRLQRLGVPNLVRVGCRNSTKVLNVLQRDFNTMMSILFDVEMAELRRVNPPVVFLDGQITDLCLSFGNKELLGRFAQTIRDRYHAEPGLVTHNLGVLIPKLQRWDIPIQFVVAPFNREGFAMKPDRATCESLLQDKNFKFIADRISVDAKPCADTYHYLREHGVCSAVLDSAEETDLKLATNMLRHQ